MTLSSASGLAPADFTAVQVQLGREPRGVLGVAHRCECGAPDVVRTSPRLPDGTPFPTYYYLTCPRLASAVSRLESDGTMVELSEWLANDGDVLAAYESAHRSYLKDRESAGAVAEIAGTTAGGMPDRVKCLHVLVAHSLAVGAGVNPLGDLALQRLPHRLPGRQCLLEEQ